MFRKQGQHVELAMAHLAKAYTNQGIDWEEACDSVESFVARQSPRISPDELLIALRCEAHRYEDM
jgi:hypothetical protein